MSEIIKKDGGPIHPNIIHRQHFGDNVHSAMTLEAEGGLSMRDWFAGMALQGLLANPGGPIQSNGMSGWSFTNCEDNDVAKLALVMADAMLAARERKEGA